MHLRLVPLLTTAALVAAPTAAHAVGIQLQQPQACFVDQGKELGTQAIPYTVTGLAASQPGNVTLTAQGITATPLPFVGPTDGSGTNQAALTWTSTFAGKPMGDVPGTLTATDPNGGVLATLPVTLGSAGLQIGNGKVQKLSKQVDWEVSGLSALTGQSTYYAFFFKAKDAVKSKNPKPVDSMKLGKGTGACGYLKSKRPITPFKKTGTYVVAVQTSKKFDPKGLTLAGAVKTALVKK